MRTRLFWKFFIGFSLFSVVMALAFYGLVMGQARGFYLQAKEESLAKLGRLVGAELAAGWPRLDATAMQALLAAKGRQAGVRFTVIDPRGTVLADSLTDPVAMQNHADRPEVAAALSGRSSSETHFSFTLRERMLYHALPLASGGRRVAALRLSFFVRDFDREFAPWRGRVTLTLGLLLGLAILLSLGLSRNLARPVNELAAAARRVASGRLDVRVDPRRRDEIGQLARDFKRMVEEQARLLEEMRHGRQELETILASLAAGLLVLDGQERVVRAGPSFRRLAGDENPVGKPVWEVLRHAGFAERVRRAAAASLHAELEIGGRGYFVSLAPLPAGRGTVVTFHDLSDSRRLARQKKDLVASVSHELRTPLTAIKGYAETMLEGAAGDERRYLEVIARNTDRLIEMVGDLLTLSELEERGKRLEREPIDWAGLLQDVAALFEKRVREKGLDLRLQPPAAGEADRFRGDRFRLEQMLVNLLDNAVKYTEKGGIAVRVGVEAERLVLEVRDSGAGIAPEHLERIFERFYVADPARSRQTGGTGLGLAIVKHIARLHGGEIAVQSRPGEGTLFSVRLPLG